MAVYNGNAADMMTAAIKALELVAVTREQPMKRANKKRQRNVIAATQELLKRNDILQQFLDDRCIFTADDMDRIPTLRLYQDFRDWFLDQNQPSMNQPTMNQQDFAQRMAKVKEIAATRKMVGKDRMMCYCSIRFRNTEEKNIHPVSRL